MEIKKDNLSENKISDSHVHLFPPEVYKNWEHYADIDPWFGKLTKTGEAWASVDEAIHCADEAGVTGLVMQGWYWNDEGLQELHNDYMAECLKKYPDRLRVFVSVNPKFKSSIKHIEKHLARGFSGIGELGPGGNGYDFNDHDFLEILECAEFNHVPVCIHCGEPLGRDYNGKDRTSLEPIPGILKKYPDLKFILAHLGGGLPFYEMLRGYGAELFQNVYYDTAANPLLYDMRSLSIVMNIVGEDRLIFGSDFPLILYPRKKKTMDMTLFIKDIKMNGNMTKKQLDKFFSKNLENIVDI